MPAAGASTSIKDDVYLSFDFPQLPSPHESQRKLRICTRDEKGYYSYQGRLSSPTDLTRPGRQGPAKEDIPRH